MLISSYITQLSTLVYNKISDNIKENCIDTVVEQNLINAHLKNNKSLKFHEYYFQILQNVEEYNKQDFFREFKANYSLQGIDIDFLKCLELKKSEILQGIKEDNIISLYFNYFYRANIKFGPIRKEKSLGSFFTKLVHTFRPDEFCALDNPVKNFFGLKKESFFVAFLVINEAYRQWTKDNNALIAEIKERFKKADNQSVFQHNKISDLKLLDMIFWSKANKVE